MNTLNSLGLKVVLITALIVIAIFGMFLGVKRLFFSGTQPTLPTTNQTTPAPTQEASLLDSDSDGLPDVIERAYFADPANPDSDSDGTPDGEEVSLQRNPAKAAPDDMLPKDASGNVQLAADTYTKKYIAQLPPDAAQSDVLQKDKLEAFVIQQQEELAKATPPVEIKTSSESGKEAVQKYIEAISSERNARIRAVTSADIEKAFQTYYVNNESSEIDAIIQILEQNLAALKDVAAPQEALDLHQRLVTASQQLLDGVKLLKTMPSDFVGGLLGAKIIEDLGPTFAQIGEDLITIQNQ